MIKARAGGGTLWYSADSDGRMLTVATARHFFGPDKTREIWMRSDRVEPASEYGCPSCQKVMRSTSLPDWVGSSTIDVCRTCRIFWIDGASFDEIPKGSQLLHARGDSTLVKDLGEAYLEHQKIKAEKLQLSSDGAVPQPDNLVENILGFLRLPIERSNRPKPEWPIISGVTLALMIVLQVFVTDQSLIASLGFYPNDPLKNFGLNIFSHAFIHGGWFHLLSNCYFAYILSDDVEDDLGSKKFLEFLVFTMIIGAIISTLIAGSRDLPHIGYSGVVMALFAYYGLQFPKAKMIWLLPRLNTGQSSNAYSARIGWGWFQVRALWVALFYLAGDTLYYFLQETSNKASVSFSGHIAGFLAGALFWAVSAPKNFKTESPDILETNMDRVLPYRSENKIQEPTAKLQPPPPKKIE
ncbi:rhomboid family intramembrane serine protease [Bdellovibrio sp. HCB337]|uniref:rhomboid family intramembrane serine protease n=1 Tax=Bdellovibrio sp. HCB337 TaxID=3394358 RepID=UPI0039A55DBF